jgi:hypothetical protein
MVNRLYIQPQPHDEIAGCCPQAKVCARTTLSLDFPGTLYDELNIYSYIYAFQGQMNKLIRFGNAYFYTAPRRD